MQESFGNLELSARIDHSSALMKAHSLIKWEALRPLLKGLYKREATRAGGQEPFDVLLMFKATLLGQWHSLSDPKLEHALTVRIDFMHFCGLKLSDPVPDESTLCRFRNRLIRADKLAPLLAAVNSQLQDHGLMVANAKGAVIDATLIAAAARPRNLSIIEHDTSNADDAKHQHEIAASTHEEVATAANTNSTISTDTSVDIGTFTSTIRQSVDPDATWVKKGSRSHFGYRTYVVVDDGNGYIRGVHTAPANQSETTHFEATLKRADFIPERVYADKGFASAGNRQVIKTQGIKSGIMHKGQRNKPLTLRQKKANRHMSKTRYIVEQCFGTMKRLFGMARASYMGTVKINAQFMMKAMCLNLLKAANKICLNDESVGVVRPA